MFDDGSHRKPPHRELPDEDLGAARMTVHEAVYDLECAAGAVNRAQRELFRAIVRCDLRRAWIEDDCRDLTHWVALRLGISIWKARRWANCARALEELPVIAEAFEEGQLSVDKVVELTRFATPGNERRLLGWAMKVAVATIRDRGDWLARISDVEVRAADRERSVKWWWNQERTRLSLFGSFPAEMGLRLTKALERAAARMPTSPVDPVDPDALVEARRADALAAMASRAIAEDADADRATVVVHAEMSALVSGDRNGVESGGRPLHPAVTQRLLCDCRYQPVLHGDDGLVVGIGKTSRLIPAGLRRQVEHRDHFRCTFPNCGSRRFTDCHHVAPWPLGPTELDNLTLLCTVHHRLVHEYGWHVMLAKDQTTKWFRPDWTPYRPREGMPRGPRATSV